jgi:cyclohexadienyl dehydratase
MKSNEKFIFIFIVICFFIIFTVILMGSKKNPAERIIKIGTTGDYKPLTWYDTNEKKYYGFDIDIAEAMSKELNVKIKFIKTTWNSINDDLANNKFDIVMSGISVTTERKKQFIFSSPVLTDKKVALVRCSDRNRLSSFSKINQKNTILIENIGGTNEMCAKQYFKNTHLILIKNNKLVFSKIINKQADAMITDKIEATYYSKQNPELLCIIDIPNEYSLK